MTAVDCETGKNIINPYILISKGGLGVLLNTETFGECQLYLIHPLDRDKYALLFKEKKCYQVDAVVGEYNGLLPGETSPIPIPRFVNTVSICRPERSKTLLGFLSEDVVEENLPKTFGFLNRKD